LNIIGDIFLISLRKYCIDFSSTKILTCDIWMNYQLLEEMIKKAYVKVNLHDVRVLSMYFQFNNTYMY
jgi:hypothetical protein